MGGFLSACVRALKWSTPPTRLVLLGLDAAGKTTLLYKLRLGEVITTVPTIGFNIEEATYKSITFVSWDLGGRDRRRPLYRHVLQGVGAVIMVVDSVDRDRIDDARGMQYGNAREELHRILEEEDARNVPLLVYANKQDLPNAMSADEVAERLRLPQTQSHRRWHCQGSCAVTGDGLYEGLDWLSDVLSKTKVVTHGTGSDSKTAVTSGTAPANTTASATAKNTTAGTATATSASTTSSTVTTDVSTTTNTTAAASLTALTHPVTASASASAPAMVEGPPGGLSTAPTATPAVASEGVSAVSSDVSTAGSAATAPIVTAALAPAAQA